MAHYSRKQQNSTSKALVATCLILVVILGALLAVLFSLPKDNSAGNIQKEVTVEAGTARIDPNAFLIVPDTNEVSLVSGISAEKLNTPGVYSVTISWKGKKYNSSLRVVDTTSPTATPVDQTAILKAPEASAFVKDIQDVSEVTVSFKTLPDMTVAGTQAVTILLTDTFGNNTEVTANLTVIIDTKAPVITGVKDVSVHLGDTVSYRTGVSVTDDYDPDVSLKIDSSAVNLDAVGMYTVVYSATDASGNETKVEATVYVREKKPNSVDLETIYAEADKLIAQIITSNMTKKQQVQAIYTWARTRCRYTGHSDKSDYLQEAYVMLTQRGGDCFSYYAVSKLLFDRLGIDNIEVRKVKNYPEDSDHYWNMVSVNGGETWYHFDATPRAGSGDDFCMVTDAFLDAYSKSHQNSHNRDKSLYPATPEK